MYLQPVGKRYSFDIEKNETILNWSKMIKGKKVPNNYGNIEVNT